MWLDFGTALLLQSSKCKFLFPTVKHSCWGTAQIQPPAADFPVLCKQCQRGRADTSRKWKLNPGEERTFSRAGLDIAWAFLVYARTSPAGTAVGQKSTKLPFFSQESCPPGALCSVVEWNIRKGPRSFLTPNFKQESEAARLWVSHAGIQ